MFEFSILDLIEEDRTTDKYDFVHGILKSSINHKQSVMKESLWSIFEGEFCKGLMEQSIRQGRMNDSTFMGFYNKDVNIYKYVSVDLHNYEMDNQTIMIHLSTKLYEAYKEYMLGNITYENLVQNKECSMLYVKLTSQYIEINSKTAGSFICLKRIRNIDSNRKFVEFYHYGDKIEILYNDKKVCSTNVQGENWKLSIMSISEKINYCLPINDIVVGDIEACIYLKPIDVRYENTQLSILYKGNPILEFFENGIWEKLKVKNNVNKNKNLLLRLIIRGKDEVHKLLIK